MKPMVGHLIDFADDRIGRHGEAYNYVLAGNGLFVNAVGQLLCAHIPLAEVPVRGLPEQSWQYQLRHGAIPSYLVDLAISTLLMDGTKERYAAICWDEKTQSYCVRVPEQTGGPGKVEYSTPENAVLELHSHPGMGAFFSSRDNADEQGLRIYGVVGRGKTGPRMRLRLGVYGYFFLLEPSEWGDVIEGTPTIEGDDELSSDTEPED